MGSRRMKHCKADKTVSEQQQGQVDTGRPQHAETPVGLASGRPPCQQLCCRARAEEAQRGKAQGRRWSRGWGARRAGARAR